MHVELPNLEARLLEAYCRHFSRPPFKVRSLNKASASTHHPTFIFLEIFGIWEHLKSEVLACNSSSPPTRPETPCLTKWPWKTPGVPCATVPASIPRNPQDMHHFAVKILQWCAPPTGWSHARSKMPIRRHGWEQTTTLHFCFPTCNVERLAAATLPLPALRNQK